MHYYRTYRSPQSCLNCFCDRVGMDLSDSARNPITIATISFFTSYFWLLRRAFPALKVHALCFLSTSHSSSSWGLDRLARTMQRKRTHGAAAPCRGACAGAELQRVGLPSWCPRHSREWFDDSTWEHATWAAASFKQSDLTPLFLLRFVSLQSVFSDQELHSCKKSCHPNDWMLLQRWELSSRLVLPTYSVTKTTCSNFANETAKKAREWRLFLKLYID